MHAFSIMFVLVELCMAVATAIMMPETAWVCNCGYELTIRCAGWPQPPAGGSSQVNRVEGLQGVRSQLRGESVCHVGVQVAT